ncbi:hypothetical protein BZG36_03810 [Bifiguratus adelaidae]|uniref:Peptidase M20 domain-containing protein 2 n=1 Tax=Bifiguratus adelaidae TaxID=1938954 RepID=A0A261XX01_9FUNG|nr:hypothetical protein BZG36_03810 [Bifiguratus adelaidae]
MDGKDYSQTTEEAIQEISDDIWKLSQELHSHPEEAFQEHYAHDLLTAYLEQQGFKVTKHAFGLETAFVAEFEHGSGGPSVGYCSEYDALPGLGHACGHNLIAISGIASAIGLRAVLQRHQISGRIVLFGTPAEESGGGKKHIIKKGGFQDVDICMMLHGANVDAVYPQFLAVQEIFVDFHGKASHASTAPWQGKNALDAMLIAFNSIAMLRQQTPPTHRMQGIITKGGEAYNIIPDKTSGQFGIRAPSKAELTVLRGKVDNIFHAAATATGCTVDICYREPALDIVSNSVLGHLFQSFMERNHITYPPRAEQSALITISTDYGNVSYVRPGLHPTFAIDTVAVLHTPAFALAAKTSKAHERCKVAAKCMALTGARVIEDKSILEEVKREFQKTSKEADQEAIP